MFDLSILPDLIRGVEISVFWKTFFSGDRLKNFCEDVFFFFFFFFFWRALALCALGPWPWPRAFLSLASRVSVLGKAVLGLGLGLGFFLCPWPWPRALCPRLHLWLKVFDLSILPDLIRGVFWCFVVFLPLFI